jgi:hypothetical protein
MIHFFLSFNRSGKNRLAKFYGSYDDEEKRKLISEVFRIASTRPMSWTNFVEFRKARLVYRRYAGLYFAVVADADMNPLSLLESIHLYVETLDVYFGKVCELDLIFNFNKCYEVLDEVFCAGCLMEPSTFEVRKRMENADRLIEPPR